MCRDETPSEQGGLCTFNTFTYALRLFTGYTHTLTHAHTHLLRQANLHSFAVKQSETEHLNKTPSAVEKPLQASENMWHETVKVPTPESQKTRFYSESRKKKSLQRRHDSRRVKENHISSDEQSTGKV